MLRLMRTFKKRYGGYIQTILLVGVVSGLFFAGGSVLWFASLKIPDLDSFDEKLLAESTKIYDKTGEVMLYNVNQDVKRSVVPFEEISDDLKHAAIAIEDAEFYNHNGVRPISFARAMLVNLFSGSYSQGGSTITQQVVKNGLLTTEKTISRKVKEWVLALKLEKTIDKDTILNLYLNGNPYGGNLYGVEEASLAFFGKQAKDVTLAEAAYITAVTRAPTYYSPYGNHRDKLDERKNLILKKMKEQGYIDDAQYETAAKEAVEFKRVENKGIKAPHFVMYVLEYLEEEYGEEAVRKGNLKVTTTLDYALQEKAEEIVKKHALENEGKFKASNAALVAIDPKTGGILTMVGSRDYFDENIDGNFNVVTSPNRQPGSTFKPFVYAAAFNKGYTPQTVLFDVDTEFSVNCTPDHTPLFPGVECYSPGNYDDQFRGPMTIKNALAQSINIPAVKALYLVGINEALTLSEQLGVTNLGDKSQYGLTLVLGGGSVSPLEMTSAYSVFANDGMRNEHTAILRVEDATGRVLEEQKTEPTRVLSEDTARNISDILSDPNARSANPYFDFSDRRVAVKTGTTNDYRDAWTIGYTPAITVGIWVGNNNNTSMEKRVAGFIVSPMWREIMDEAFKLVPNESFGPAPAVDPSLKPILRGQWQGGSSYTIDLTTGRPATEETPTERRQTVFMPDVHTILYWVDKNDPTGPIPSNPQQDGQFNNWETAVRRWAGQNGSTQPIPTGSISITYPNNGGTYNKKDKLAVQINYPSESFTRTDIHLNGALIGSMTANGEFSFVPERVHANIGENELKAIAYGEGSTRSEHTIRFVVAE